MPLIKSIIKQINLDHPDIIIKPGQQSLWSPSDNTIFYEPKDKNRSISLLHELAHALLRHNDYDQDIQLLVMERKAWEYTKKIAPKYRIKISEEIIQENLDSYRQWLHDRSTCPKCHNNGNQINQKTYKCPACSNKWQVNEARSCSLKRYNLK